MKTTMKLCEVCKVEVFYYPPQPKITEHAMVYPITCEGGNSPHFCERGGKGSFHDVFQCTCLNGESMYTDTLVVELAIPGYTTVPPKTSFTTVSFPSPRGRTYVICEKGDLYRYGPRKKVIETGETIEIPNTNDKEYLTTFNEIITFRSVNPTEQDRTYYAAFKAGRVQQVWYEKTK